MPINIEAIVTDKGREALLKSWGQFVVFSEMTTFKVGEGGWEDTAGGRVPRDPTDEGTFANRGPTLTDLDCISNPSDYPSDSRGNFSKGLTSGDFAVSGNTILEITCYLAMADFNDDGNGNFPEIYEVGVFDAGGDMVAYGTCPVVEKNPAVDRTFVIKISALRSS